MTSRGAPGISSSRRPAAVHSLEELGDWRSDVALSGVAVTEPFRILSDEGVTVAQAICRELETQAEGDARSKRLRGCTYRSNFLAGMYADPELLAFLREIAMAPLQVHPIGHHRVQLNFAPEILSRDVDVWHADVVAYDFVMMVTDPDAMVGGDTEYFVGPVEEGLAILAAAKALPAERVRAVRYPGPGWGIFQQGHRVLHRAARLEEPYPRISLVASYYCADPEFREPTILPPCARSTGEKWRCASGPSTRPRGPSPASRASSRSTRLRRAAGRDPSADFALARWISSPPSPSSTALTRAFCQGCYRSKRAFNLPWRRLARRERSRRVWTRRR